MNPCRWWTVALGAGADRDINARERTSYALTYGSRDVYDFIAGPVMCFGLAGYHLSDRKWRHFAPVLSVMGWWSGAHVGGSFKGEAALPAARPALPLAPGVACCLGHAALTLQPHL